MKISKLQLIIIVVICVILTIIIMMLGRREMKVATPEGPAQIEKPFQPEISKYTLPERKVPSDIKKTTEWEPLTPETQSVSSSSLSKLTKKIIPKKIAQEAEEPAVPDEPDKYRKYPTPEQLNEIRQKGLIIY